MERAASGRGLGDRACWPLPRPCWLKRGEVNPVWTADQAGVAPLQNRSSRASDSSGSKVTGRESVSRLRLWMRGSGKRRSHRPCCSNRPAAMAPGSSEVQTPRLLPDLLNRNLPFNKVVFRNLQASYSLRSIVLNNTRVGKSAGHRQELGLRSGRCW